MNNKNNATFCASCKHWSTSEPYYDERAYGEDNPDGIVEYPICGNKDAERYNDYAPCDCYACELYERDEK